MVKRPVFFYGWVIVGIGIVLMVLIYGTRHSFSVFFPPILDEFGWSRGSTALMLSLNLLVYGFTAPVAGSLADRWKPKSVMIMGVIILGLALASCGFASELWHFYLLFGVLVPIGNAFSGWPLLGPALANWFTKRRGLVLGLSMMGSGLSFTYGIFVELLISRFDWRQAYFIVAGILVVILLPLLLFLFQHKPGNKGLKAYGTNAMLPDNELTSKIDPAQNHLPTDWTLGQAMRSYRLWLLVISQALYWGIGCYLVLAHQVKFAQDIGYTSTFAASIFALFGIFMAVGELSGFISDLIGRERAVFLATIMEIIALVALISVTDTSQPWLLYVYAVCFGYGAGLYLPTFFAGVADIFHGKHYGAIAGLSLTGAGIGGVIGPWLGGYMYDTSGSYISAFYLCIVSFILSFVAFWIAAPGKVTVGNNY
jgi:sugar phosphate permease